MFLSFIWVWVVLYRTLQMRKLIWAASTLDQKYIEVGRERLDEEGWGKKVAYYDIDIMYT